MAKAFNLTAQINFQTSSLRPVIADIKRELSGITADVNLKIDPNANKSIINITNRLRAMNKVLVQSRGNVAKLNTSFRELSASLGSAGMSGAKIAGGLQKTVQAASSSATSLRSAATEMEEFGKQSALAIRRFAAFSVVTSGIFSLIGAVTSGVKAFISFDAEMIKLQQVTGKGAIGLRSLEKEITRLATTFGVSSESLASVASTLAQAGLTAEETRVALSALAKTELAPSFENLTQTTEGAIAAMRQFGISANDLEGALGSINAVAAAFAVESKDIISAIQRTGGVFASASRGVSEGTLALNEFLAVFTSVRASTRESAETIATGLRTIFARIQRGDTIEALKDYGINLTDLEGKFVGAYKAVELLSKGLSTLDPRDLKFSKIVEELGGFRQIGKVLPLIKEYAVREQALAVAQKGKASLTEAQVTAQKSLANQLSKVKEQFLALIREIGKSVVFDSLFRIVTSLTSGLISLVGAFKPILPMLAILGAVKGVSALTQFASGFSGGLSKGGKGAKGVGENIGGSLSGAKDKEKSDTTNKATSAILANTTAVNSLTNAINALTTGVNSLTASKSATLNSGGLVKKFARGGVVPGFGSGDTVPAMLEPGEFVIRKKAVQTLGSDKLHDMNKSGGGQIRGYAGGGKVQKFAEGGPFRVDKLQKHQKTKIDQGMQQYSVLENDDRVSANIIDSTQGAANLTRDEVVQIYNKKPIGEWKKLLKNPLGSSELVKAQKGDKYTQDLKVSGEFSKQDMQKFGIEFGSAERLWGAGYEEVIRDRYALHLASNDQTYPVDTMNPTPTKTTSGDSYNWGEIKFKTKPEVRTKLVAKLLSQRINENSINEYFKEGLKNETDDAKLGNIEYYSGIQQGSKAPSHKLQFYKDVQQLAIGGEVSPTLVGVPDNLAKAKAFQATTASDVAKKFLRKRLPNESAFAQYAGADITNDLIKSAWRKDTKLPNIKDYLQEGMEKDAARIKEAKEQDIAKSYKFGLVGLAPFDYSDIIGPQTLSQTSSTIFAKGLPKQYSKGIDSMREGLSGVVNKLATDIQTTGITYGNKDIALDFDETLFGGADLFDKNGKIDIEGYSDLNRVMEGLNKGEITPLGSKIKELIGLDPSFLDRLSVITARPQSNAGLLAAKLSEIGIPIPVNKITGTSGGGSRKADVMTTAQKLVDDNLENIKAVRSRGLEGVAYSPVKGLTEDQKKAAGFAGAEGNVLEATLAALGATGGAIQNRSVDYANGLGPMAAQYFPGLNPTWPTEVKRTINGDSISDAKEQFATWLKAKGMASGGKVDFEKGVGESPFSKASSSGRLGQEAYDLLDKSGLSNESNSILQFANSAGYNLEEFKTYLTKRAEQKRAKAGIKTDSKALLKSLTPGVKTATASQLALAEQLKGTPDAGYRPIPTEAENIASARQDINNAMKKFAVGGVAEAAASRARKLASGGAISDTVPAMLTPGEFVINKEAAKNIGYSKLNKMNKADKIKGYAKGGAVQHFVTGGEVDGPVSVGGLNVKNIQSLIKVISSLQKTMDSKDLTNADKNLEETIGKLSLGIISSEEATVELGTILRASAISAKKAGNEDLAQGFKKMFDRVDALQQKRGGSDSLRDVTTTKMGLGMKPQVIVGGFPGASPATPTPVSPTPVAPSPTTTSSLPDSTKIASEQMAFFAYKAKEAGMSVETFKKKLAKDIVSRSKEMVENQANKKMSFQLEATNIGASIKNSNISKNASGAYQDAGAGAAFDEAVNNFTTKLKEIDPSLGPKEANDAAIELATGLNEGTKSVQELLDSNKALSAAMIKTISETEALASAEKELASREGMNSEILKRGMGDKAVKNERFIQSDAGKRLGRFAELAPEKAQAFSNSRSGKFLGKASDTIISGKGLTEGLEKRLGSAGRFLGDKISALGGPFNVLAGGLALAGEALTKFVSDSTSPEVAAAAGGFKGAAGGALSGSVAGAQLAGPVGALVGGVAGAVIGGITGAFDAYNDKTLENNLKRLGETSDRANIAINKMSETATEFEISNARDAIKTNSQSIKALAPTAKLGATGSNRKIIEFFRAFDITGITASVTGMKQEAEARQALIAAMRGEIENMSKLGAQRLKTVRTSDIGSAVDTSITANKKIVELDKQIEATADPVQKQNLQNQKTAIKKDKTESLYKGSQTFVELRKSGIDEESSLLRMAQAQSADPEKFARESNTPEGRKKNLQRGKELAAEEAETANSLELLRRSTKAMTLASDGIIDKYRKIESGLDRISESFDSTTSSLDALSDTLNGRASISKIDRSQTSEAVLKDMSGYSVAEVNSAAQSVGALAGGGKAGAEVSQGINAAKMIKDVLPEVLRDAKTGDVGEIMKSLDQKFADVNLVLPPAVRKELEDSLNAKLVTGESGTSVNELAGDSAAIEALSKNAQAMADAGLKASKTYNDGLDTARNYINKFSEATMQATELVLQGASIRSNAENSLAQTLGKDLTVSQLNKPTNDRILGLTTGLVAGGSTDSNTIAKGLDAARGEKQKLEKEGKDPNADKSAAAEKARLDAISAQDIAINNGTKALNELANSGDLASNALSAIQDRAKLKDNAKNLIQKVLTSDPTQLADLSKNLSAYTAASSGTASNGQMNSLEFRKQAFAGQEEIASVLPPAEAAKLKAQMTLNMIKANPRSQEILGRTIGKSKDENGNDVKMTVEQALSDAAAGKDPAQDKYIEAYRAATTNQANAADRLADAATAVAAVYKNEVPILLESMFNKIAALFQIPQQASEEKKAKDDAASTAADKKAEDARGQGLTGGTLPVGTRDVAQTTSTRDTAVAAGSGAAATAGVATAGYLGLRLLRSGKGQGQAGATSTVATPPAASSGTMNMGSLSASAKPPVGTAATAAPVAATTAASATATNPTVTTAEDTASAPKPKSLRRAPGSPVNQRQPPGTVRRPAVPKPVVRAPIAKPRGGGGRPGKATLIGGGIAVAGVAANYLWNKFGGGQKAAAADTPEPMLPQAPSSAMPTEASASAGGPSDAPQPFGSSEAQSLASGNITIDSAIINITSATINGAGAASGTFGASGSAVGVMSGVGASIPGSKVATDTAAIEALNKKAETTTGASVPLAPTTLPVLPATAAATSAQTAPVVSQEQAALADLGMIGTSMGASAASFTVAGSAINKFGNNSLGANPAATAPAKPSFLNRIKAGMGGVTTPAAAAPASISAKPSLLNRATSGIKGGIKAASNVKPGKGSIAGMVGLGVLDEGMNAFGGPKQVLGDTGAEVYGTARAGLGAATTAGMIPLNTAANALTTGYQFATDPKGTTSRLNNDNSGMEGAARKAKILGGGTTGAVLGNTWQAGESALGGLMAPVETIAQGGIQAGSTFNATMGAMSSSEKTQRMLKSSKYNGGSVADNTYGLTVTDRAAAAEQARFQSELKGHKANNNTTGIKETEQKLAEAKAGRIKRRKGEDNSFGGMIGFGTSGADSKEYELAVKTLEEKSAKAKQTGTEKIKDTQPVSVPYDQLSKSDQKKTDLFKNQKMFTANDPLFEKNKAAKMAELGYPPSSSTPLAKATTEAQTVVEPATTAPSTKATTEAPPVVERDFTREELDRRESVAMRNRDLLGRARGEARRRGDPNWMEAKGQAVPMPGIREFEAEKEAELAAQTPPAPLPAVKPEIAAAAPSTEQVYRLKPPAVVKPPETTADLQQQLLNEPQDLFTPSVNTGKAIIEKDKARQKNKLALRAKQGAMTHYKDTLGEKSAAYKQKENELSALKIGRGYLSTPQEDEQRARQKNKLAIRAKEGALGNYSRGSEEFKNKQAELTTLKKERAKFSPETKKPLTPYQTAQAAKREAYVQSSADNKKSARENYLSRFRPEIQEKMLTKKEKEERNRASTTSMAQNEPPKPQGPANVVPPPAPYISGTAPTSQVSAMTLPGGPSSNTPLAQAKSNAPEKPIPSGPSPVSTATNQQMMSPVSFDQKALDGLVAFNVSFGDHVNNLKTILDNFPSKIEMNGKHTVEVTVSGAAAFDALQDGIKKLINTEISAKMAQIWQKSGGALGAPEGTAGTPKNS